MIAAAVWVTKGSMISFWFAMVSIRMRLRCVGSSRNSYSGETTFFIKTAYVEPVSLMLCLQSWTHATGYSITLTTPNLHGGLLCMQQNNICVQNWQKRASVWPPDGSAHTEVPHLTNGRLRSSGFTVHDLVVVRQI